MRSPTHRRVSAHTTGNAGGSEPAAGSKADSVPEGLESLMMHGESPFAAAERLVTDSKTSPPIRVHADLPPCVLAGAVVRADCVITNLSERPVDPGSFQDLRLAGRWTSAAGTVMETERAEVREAIEPGRNLVVPLEIRAPNVPGTYGLRITLLDEGVRWFDELREGNAAVSHLEVLRVTPAPEATGDLSEDLRLMGGYLALRFGRPSKPYTTAYESVRDSFIDFVLGNDALLEAFRSGLRLPAEFGVAMDERVVEYPWVLARLRGGRGLDGGSALNFAHILDHFAPRFDDLHIVTMFPEAHAFWQRRVSYTFADMRDLPYRDEFFDSVISISTLEHIGMDSSVYGGTAPRAPDPAIERERTLRELLRVVRPGGQVLITVPFGVYDDFDWQITLGGRELERLVAAAGGATADVAYLGYSTDGWNWVEPEIARQSRTYDKRSGAGLGDDLAVGARAVACIELTRVAAGA